MEIKALYRKRPVRFIEICTCGEWKVKVYSISGDKERVDEAMLEKARVRLPEWLQQAWHYGLDTYRIATLIVHEGKEGCFAIVSCWIDENMLQLFVYLAKQHEPGNFTLYSDKGIVSCVWEMAVLWHERNAWVTHVLSKAGNPDIAAYLNAQLNEDV